MAAKEMYDYLDVATPDNNVTLTLKARGAVREIGMFNQVVHQGDDASREVVTLATDKISYLDYPWKALDEDDAGTIFDYYFDTAKGYGLARSFKLDYPDGHTYVVMFDSELPRTRGEGYY